MRTFSVIYVVIFLVASLSFPVFSRENKITNEVRLGNWHTELYGRAKIDGVSFNLKGNGNFSNENSIDFFWKHKIGKLSDVSISYHNVDNSGTINIPITINNVKFGANARLEIEMTSIDLVGYREIVSGPKGYLDFMYGIKFLDYDFDASDPTGTVKPTSDSYTFPLPQFGIGGEYYFNKRWMFKGAFYGFSIHRDDDGGLVKTLDTAVQYRFNPDRDDIKKVDWSLLLGWKAQYVSGNDNKDEIVIDHEGAIFGLVGKF